MVVLMLSVVIFVTVCHCFGLSVLEVFLQWTPIVDGVDLLDLPIALFLKGEVAPIPLIIVCLMSTLY